MGEGGSGVERETEDLKTGSALTAKILTWGSNS